MLSPVMSQILQILHLPARALFSLACTLAFRAALADYAAPELKEAGLRIELIAAEPDLVTPIGCAVDGKGRVYVVESHTHFRPKGYDGPKADIIKVWSDSNGDGKPDKVSIFADGLVKTMNIAFAPDGSLYVTQRDAVFRMRDNDGDGKADTKETILKLQTTEDYPHNGLDSTAFGPDGMLYVGMGENLGVAYTLLGSDRSQEQSSGEGANIFRCTLDGRRLERWATGFWNAFGLHFITAGQLFMVDNDPDSRPPCRLNHVIRGGDYGFKYRHGRKGTHPFTAWNGELPGTLPMVAGTGEAPSGVIEASKAKLTSAFDGSLIVTGTWEHTLERFRLEPRGASWQAKREIFAVGDGDFRPVALAPAPDGSIYITDWVKADYPVHKHGRLWRLSAEKPVAVKPIVLTEAHKRLMSLDAAPASEVLDALRSDDPFLQTAAADRLAREGSVETIIVPLFAAAEPRLRLGGLIALRRLKSATPEQVTALLSIALRDTDESVRLFAAKWAGEDMIGALYLDVLMLKEGAISDALKPVVDATLDLLIGKPDLGPLANRPAKDEFTIFPLDGPQKKRREDARRVLRGESQRNDERSFINAFRDVAGSDDPNDVPLLLPFAQDKRRPAAFRAEAVAAIATANVRQSITELLPLLEDPDLALRRETVRALGRHMGVPEPKASLEKALANARAAKSPALIEQLEGALGLNTSAPPASDDEWRKLLDAAPGDPASGRRVFFQHCTICHMAEGHGAGLVGPDLTTIARTADRERILQSILHPSRDIAPQFVTVQMTRGNDVQLGRLDTRHADQSVTLVGPTNTGIFIPAREIVSTNMSPVSLMPEGLALAMTRSDFRDLVAYLLSLK
jgi:putative membrane-bound dehydrogenase-like protein